MEYQKNYIITGHGADVTSLNKSFIKVLKKNCLKKARHITVVSERLKQEVMDLYNIPSKKISIISMGCDTSNFSPDLKNKKYFKDNGKKNIIYAQAILINSIT